MHLFGPQGLILIGVASAELSFTGTTFQEGSSAAWWSDDWAQSLYDTMDQLSPEVFDLYFVGNENAKRPEALERAGDSIEQQLNDFREDILRRRDRCLGEYENGDGNGDDETGNGDGNMGTGYRRRRQAEDDERRVGDSKKQWFLLNKVAKDIEEMFWQHARWVREEIFVHCPTMGNKLFERLERLKAILYWQYCAKGDDSEEFCNTFYFKEDGTPMSHPRVPRKDGGNGGGGNNGGGGGYGGGNAMTTTTVTTTVTTTSATTTSATTTSTSPTTTTAEASTTAKKDVCYSRSDCTKMYPDECPKRSCNCKNEECIPRTTTTEATTTEATTTTEYITTTTEYLTTSTTLLPTTTYKETCNSKADCDDMMPECTQDGFSCKCRRGECIVNEVTTTTSYRSTTTPKPETTEEYTTKADTCTSKLSCQNMFPDKCANRSCNCKNGECIEKEETTAAPTTEAATTSGVCTTKASCQKLEPEYCAKRSCNCVDGQCVKIETTTPYTTTPEPTTASDTCTSKASCTEMFPDTCPNKSCNCKGGECVPKEDDDNDNDDNDNSYAVTETPVTLEGGVETTIEY